MEFPFKTTPLAHQAREFELSRATPGRAYWWEPGCGKTKTALDTGASLYLAREIEAMVVVAPGGVHENWAWEEAPIHLSDEVAEGSKTFVWRTNKRRSNKYAVEWREFCAHRGFKLACLSYDAMMTDDSAAKVKRFLEEHRSLLVLDESDAMKNPSAARTKRMVASARWAPFRRALSGTPVDDSPFDIYTQARFVEPTAWHEFGIQNSLAFRSYFGEWEQRRTTDGFAFPKCVRYKNLDQLNRKILELGSRLLKKDVVDLPEKLYEKVYFELEPDQLRMAQELEGDYRAWFGDGSSVTAELAIVRLIRMQQLSSGFLPADDERLLRPLAKRNPRLAALRTAMERVGDAKVIVWAKYDQDVELILGELKEYSVVRYDGTTTPEERLEAKTRFQRGDAQVFVGKCSVAGRGLTLHAAKFAIFYNNTFRLLERRQAEDRCHRTGMDARSPTYIDLVGRGSVDDYILQILRAKRETAALVMGDELPPWT